MTTYSIKFRANEFTTGTTGHMPAETRTVELPANETAEAFEARLDADETVESYTVARSGPTTQNQIDGATNLTELRDTLNAACGDETIADIDTSELPTFGGSVVGKTTKHWSVYSWDADSVLVCDTCCGGDFMIVPRETDLLRSAI